MSSGYVLDFSDRTFGEFFDDVADIDIHSDRYQSQGSSKAKKLRSFWDTEPDPIVGKVLLALVELLETPSDPFGSGEIDPEHNELVSKCRDIANRLHVGGPNLGALTQNAARLDAMCLQQQIRRMEQAVESDPTLAIGTAKELIETCCKTILEERQVPLPSKNPDIPALTRAVLRELQLVPEGVPQEARGADVTRRILGNLETIGNGLAELRNLYGTGHGKDGRTPGLSPRHARLAVGAATTLVNFLFETHNDRTNQT